MSRTESTRLKVNWFPVQIPAGKLKVHGLFSDAKGDYRQFRNVRQYTVNKQQLAVCIAAGPIPQGFEEIDVDPLPKMMSTLIYESFIDLYLRRNFTVAASIGVRLLQINCLGESLDLSCLLHVGL